MDSGRTELRARIDVAHARLIAALEAVEAVDYWDYDREVEYLNAYDEHLAALHALQAAIAVDVAAIERQARAIHDALEGVIRRASKGWLVSAAALGLAGACADVHDVAGDDTIVDVAPRSLDSRCLGFVRDWCGVARGRELALVSADGVPLDVADSQACVADLADGWSVRVDGALHVVGDCSAPLTIDVVACMRALGEVDAVGVDAMLIACSSPVGGAR